MSLPSKAQIACRAFSPHGLGSEQKDQIAT